MNKIDYVKKHFKDYYIDNGPENGILQGTKYAGCSTHCRAYLNTLVRMIKPKSILEIGSYHYDSTMAMSKAMDTYLDGNEGVIHTFDIKVGGYDGFGTTRGLDLRIKPMYWLPYKTSYDSWKMVDAGIVHKEFINHTNDEIFDKNHKILLGVSPTDGYDLIFIDGDHSYEGVKRDWLHALSVSNKETLIVLDNVWDIRLNDVRVFYNELANNKWDFEEWNDDYKKDNMVQDTAIILPF